MHVWTEVENHSAEEITMEMLSSFALQNVVADKIHRIQSFWSQKENEVMHVWTEVENHSAEEITMEMLSSFALQNVVADKIHRIQSFWSAEGRLRTETIEELNLECSWNGCATKMLWQIKFTVFSLFGVQKEDCVQRQSRN